MMAEEKTNPWINSSPSYVRPRLFTAFYEEAKSSLRQKTATTVSGNGMGMSAISEHNLTATMGRRTLRSMFPDTLYMIEGGNAEEALASQQSNQLGLHNPNYFPRGESLKPGDIGKGLGLLVEFLIHPFWTCFMNKMMNFSNSVVDPEILSAMLYRFKKLQSAHHRSLNLVPRDRASKYLRLRVVREFGFPDYVSEVRLPPLL
jgi:hypothetical protein